MPQSRSSFHVPGSPASPSAIGSSGASSPAGDRIAVATRWVRSANSEIRLSLQSRTHDTRPHSDRRLVVSGFRIGTVFHEWSDHMVNGTRITPSRLLAASLGALLIASTAWADVRQTDAGFVVVGGERIYYESTGSGEVVVFSHGAGGNHAIWVHQTPVFAEKFRVVTWDQRGWGKSTDVRGLAGDSDTAVEDLRRLLDHLDIDAAHLVGQSMGGWAVAGFALRYPERTRSLVLANTYGGLSTEPMREWITAERWAEVRGACRESGPRLRHHGPGAGVPIRPDQSACAAAGACEPR